MPKTSPELFCLSIKIKHTTVVGHWLITISNWSTVGLPSTENSSLQVQSSSLSKKRQSGSSLYTIACFTSAQQRNFQGVGHWETFVSQSACPASKAFWWCFTIKEITFFYHDFFRISLQWSLTTLPFQQSGQCARYYHSAFRTLTNCKFMNHRRQLLQAWSGSAPPFPGWFCVQPPTNGP